jgi:hypothetical protein
MNPQVLTLSLLFSLKLTEGHLIAYHQKIYPKSESKMDTKNHEKNHFSLTTCQFLFSKYMTIKGLYISNNVCWIFEKKKKLDFQKVFSKKGHLWFHFNKLDFE